MAKNLIFINGATKGLGKALVEQLSQDDYNLLICFLRNSKKVKNILNIKNNIRTEICDFSKIKSVDESKYIFDKYINDSYSKTFLINNIGIVSPIEKFEYLNNKEIIQSTNTNIISSIIFLKNFILSIKQTKLKAYILNISSGIANNPVPGLLMYGVNKNYIEYITKYLNTEFPGNELFVSSFLPGGIKTDMQSELQTKLKNNNKLSNFDYTKIYNQKLRAPKEISNIIYQNYFLNDKGWKKQQSTIYDFIE